MVAASGPTGILAGRPSASPTTECQEVNDARSIANKKQQQQTKIKKNEDGTKHRHETDLYVRPSWTDATLALDQIEKVRLTSFSLIHSPPHLNVHTHTHTRARH